MKKLTLLIFGVLFFTMSCQEDSGVLENVAPVNEEALASANPLLKKFLKSEDYALFKSTQKNGKRAARTLDFKKAQVQSIPNLPIQVLTIPVINGGSRYIEKPTVVNGKHVKAARLAAAYDHPRDQMEIEFFNDVEEVYYYNNTQTGESVSFIKNINGSRRYWPDGYEEYYTTVRLRTIDDLYNIGGKRYAKWALGELIPQDIPDSYDRKPKWKNFNQCYQSKKQTCESDWVCDAACSINPCFVAYIAACVYEMW